MIYMPKLRPLVEKHNGIYIEVTYEKRFTTMDDITHDEQHIHDFYELYINLSGDVSFLVENNLYPIHRGDMILTAPNELHRCIYHKDCVHEHFCIWVKDIPFASKLLKNEFETNKLVILSDRRKQELIDLCFRLYQSYTEDETYQCRAVSSFAGILDLICTHRKNTVSTYEPLPEAFSKVVDYIICNYMNPNCNVTTLCNEFYISKSTLCRTFQRHFQMTPSNYIEAKRFSEAKKLLSAGYSVQHASINSGFSDCSYFIMRFHKKFGMTPAKYQRLFIQSNTANILLPSESRAPKEEK